LPKRARIFLSTGSISQSAISRRVVTAPNPTASISSRARTPSLDERGCFRAGNVTLVELRRIRAPRGIARDFNGGSRGDLERSRRGRPANTCTRSAASSTTIFDQTRSSNSSLVTRCRARSTCIARRSNASGCTRTTSPSLGSRRSSSCSSKV
jgi:hypothetical protein